MATSEGSQISHGRASEVSEVERELKRTSLIPSEGGSSTGRRGDGETVQLLGPSGSALGEEDSALYARTRFVRHEDAGVIAGPSGVEEELVVDLPPLCECENARHLFLRPGADLSSLSLLCLIDQDASVSARSRPTSSSPAHPLAPPTPDKTAAAALPHPLASSSTLPSPPSL